MRTRVAAIIIKDDKILLMRRVKEGKEYYTFSGGGVEEGETNEEALKREIKEEAGLDIKIDKLLFALGEAPYDPKGKYEKDFEAYYYLVSVFSGELKLGGLEKARMNESNQYYLEWKNISDLPALPLVPEGAKYKIIEVLKEQSELTINKRGRKIK